MSEEPEEEEEDDEDRNLRRTAFHPDFYMYGKSEPNCEWRPGLVSRSARPPFPSISLPSLSHGRPARRQGGGGRRRGRQAQGRVHGRGRGCGRTWVADPLPRHRQGACLPRRLSPLRSPRAVISAGQLTWERRVGHLEQQVEELERNGKQVRKENKQLTKDNEALHEELQASISRNEKLKVGGLRDAPGQGVAVVLPRVLF